VVIYIDPMPNMILAPVESERTTTCLNVDRVEWAIFVELMRDEGRSASDGVRQMVRDTVRKHQAKERQRAA
jgi:hypothetical protein